MDSRDNLEVLISTALPSNSDTFFMQLAGQDSAVQSLRRYPQPPMALEGALRSMDPVAMFVLMMNEGNYVDIVAWLRKIGDGATEGLRKWASLAQGVISICEDVMFHYYRAKIFQPFAGKGSKHVGADIEMCKQAMLRLPGVPQGVQPDMLSWDLISGKIYPSAIEFFAHRYPQVLDTLDQTQMSILNQVEIETTNLIKEKCAEWRQRTQTVADDFLPDVSIFLEQQFGGMKDSDREQRISSMGKGILLQYISDMLPIFATGHLPSCVAPSKIYACHDIISSGELRGTIMKLAESMVIQQSTVLDRRLIMNRAYSLSKGMDLQGKDWTPQQMASIALKRNTDIFQKRVLNTFGVNYDNPMANLENQLAGSSNTIGQQMEGHTSDAVINMNEEQEEMAKHTLSVLLACLRMRANATQQSGWELMLEDDLDHLEIVKFLALQLRDPTSGDNNLYKIASIMQEEYQDGHNVVKFGGKDLDKDLVKMILYTMRGRAMMLLKQIPNFDIDIRSGGSGIFSVFMWCMLQSIVQKQRLQNEIDERTQRKQISDQAQMDIM